MCRAGLIRPACVVGGVPQLGDVFRSAPVELEDILREAGDETVPDRGVLFVDPRGFVGFANHRMAELLGLDLAELVGADYDSCVSSRLSADQGAQESGKPAADGPPGDDVIVFGDSPRERFIHRYSAPVFGADGQFAGRAEVYSDISYRRRLEQLVLERQVRLALQNQELRQAQDTLIRTVKLATLGELAAGVAHRLNNVLGVILGNIQLMIKRDLDQNLREELRMCELAARDGAETVRRIRSLSWLDQSVPAAPVDINEIVREVVLLTKQEARGEHNSDRAELDVIVKTNPVPQVIGCAAELREALVNIVTNAIQATAAGGEVCIETAYGDDFVRVRVRDTGVGMTQEVRSRIFLPFYTTRGPEGTGLGMSIAEAVITKHGGRIDVDSEPGKGTTVSVRLPAVADPAGVPDRLESPRPLGPNAAHSDTEDYTTAEHNAG